MAEYYQNYNQMDAIQKLELQNKEKTDKFKNRLKPFAELNTIEEAKALAKKILPVASDITRFRVGNAKCVIINRDNLFRISVDTNDEFFVYNFEQ